MCDNTQKIKRLELVELTVPGGATGRVTFQTIPQLRNQANQVIIIKSISVFDIYSYAYSQVTNSIPGMDYNEWYKAVLVLYVNGEESIKMIPLTMLSAVATTALSGQPIPYLNNILSFDDLTNVDWDKSYVQFNQPAAASTYVIPFAITYIRMQVNPSGGWQES